jgi:hypothetical protein
MGTLFRNPIICTFAGIGAALLLLSIFIGLHLSQTLQLIFVPYTYDITHGVGATGAKIYSAALGVAQVGLITLATFGVKLEKTITRRVVWSIGVVLVIIYFVIMVLGFLINNFH